MSGPVMALTRTEAALLIRNPTAVFMGLALPTLLLILQGFVIPGLSSPLGGHDPFYAHLRGIDVLAPLALLVTIASVALVTFPVSFAGYRETGVLRRLQATPAGATRLLTAQLITCAVTVALGGTIAVAVALMLFDVRAPASPLLLLLTTALTMLALFAVGAVIAGRVANARNANGIGVLLFFLCLLAAGLWTPGPMMPELMRTLTAFTPFGAASQSISAAWLSGEVPFLQLAVLAAWVAVAGLIAVKTFRWR